MDAQLKPKIFVYDFERYLFRFIKIKFDTSFEVIRLETNNSVYSVDEIKSGFVVFFVYNVDDLVEFFFLYHRTKSPILVGTENVDYINKLKGIYNVFVVDISKNKKELELNFKKIFEFLSEKPIG